MSTPSTSVTDQFRAENLGQAKLHRVIPTLFAVYALAHILFIAFLWQNHAAFPLNLEAMELTRLQHLRRIMDGLPLYVEPSSNFVALAYNPLSYYLTVPFAWIFGANLFTMRLVAILGTLGAEVVIFLAIRRATRSYWWSLMATGLFAAAYRAMDTYLDNAHADSWLLFTALLGCYLIEQRRSRVLDLCGVLLLISAFWFKQHGALFTIGGICYLTWRDGWQKALPAWLLAIVLGPGLYLAAPSWLFGSQFHYFTWEVPHRWSTLDFYTLLRFIGYPVKYYFILAVVGLGTSAFALWRLDRKVSIWFFMLPMAVATGLMAALDAGGNNNTFIPLGTWLIITGTLGLKQLRDHNASVARWQLHLIAFGVSFILFSYNPSTVIVSPHAATAYQDLVSYLKRLDGSVYAPWIGQLQDGYKFAPAVHWVPMQDIVRSPGTDQPNHPLIRRLLAPVLKPKGKAYLFMPYPLEQEQFLVALKEKYVLDTDTGDRFKALSPLPKRFNSHYPRYLYRYKTDT